MALAFHRIPEAIVCCQRCCLLHLSSWHWSHSSIWPLLKPLLVWLTAASPPWSQHSHDIGVSAVHVHAAQRRTWGLATRSSAQQLSHAKCDDHKVTWRNMKTALFTRHIQFIHCCTDFNRDIAVVRQVASFPLPHEKRKGWQTSDRRLFIGLLFS